MDGKQQSCFDYSREKTETNARRDTESEKYREKITDAQV
jgi:hypothetical protein